MAYVGLDTGTAANAGDGSTLRAGGNIVNANFQEIYNYFGDGSTLSFAGGNWIEVATGINTLSYVGIATTNPTDPLTVLGAANISGVITASSFSGIGSFTDSVVSGASTVNGNLLVGAGITFYGSTGIISATQYYGDGSSLLSVPSGLGTALSDDNTSALNKIYYVDAVLGVGATITVDPPTSSQVAFTNFPTIAVDDTYDLIVADGDDFIPDILGIGTTGIGGVMAGSGGRVRADNYTDRAGGAPTFPAGVVVSGVTTSGGIIVSGVSTLTGNALVGSYITCYASSGIISATSFSGAATGLTGTFTGDVTGNLTGTASTATAAASAYALTGSPNVTVNNLTVSGDQTVGGALTVTGNFTVDGTQTIINTSILDIEDKTVGIASTTNASNSSADGAGIEIYASYSTANNNKTLTWQNNSGCFVRSVPDRFLGVSETVSAATTYTDASGNIVLEMDIQAGTVFTHTIPAVSSSGRGANIGIVSFKNMYADANNFTTVTLITTQGAAHGGGTGYGNTVATNGIGVTCTIIPLVGSTAIAGISTRGRGSGGAGTGAGSTVTLSPAIQNSDFISFGIHYNGGTNTALTSYKVYVSKNGGFTWGSVGI